MTSIFDILKLEMANLSLMTEFLESCDWDEDESNEKIEIAIELFKCEPLPIAGLDFDEWADMVVRSNLELAGFTDKQADIIIRLIFNSRDEILAQSEMPEC
jgi:hypothetical protein